MSDANKDPTNNSSIYSFIDNLQASGGTKFNDAFDVAYSIFDNSSLIGESTSGCQKAILFLACGDS